MKEQTPDTQSIRSSFLEFFTKKNHRVVSSASLVPAGDPTLLFTNAGMVPFKDCFLGLDVRDYVRATSCQKCLRISGKHNDLENVGRTARHHTFFEMLGNFSFGDYFKQEAIVFAWEFLVDVLKLDVSRLWVTVYEKDDEAFDLWPSLTGISPERVLRLGEKDNFWAMGETGPCGPCSEIHYFLGDNLEAQNAELFYKDDGSFLEIWNLVFMQYDRSISGELTPLPKPSVDTGMGLERLAAVLQGAKSNYDTDIFRAIISQVEKLSGKRYDGLDYTIRNINSDQQYAYDVAMRVAADHLRAVSFLIADGVLPSADGRGYVLRRLVRRACRHGRSLGFHEPFLFKLVPVLVDKLQSAYPQLKEQQNKIERVLRSEEEKFLTTLETGLNLLAKEVEKLKHSSSKILPGQVAFSLYDTYGFPLDLTEDILLSEGITLDHSGYQEEMSLQKERSRAARQSDAELRLRAVVKPLGSEFVGYEHNVYESNISGIFTPEGEAPSASEGQQVAVVVAQTPFYAESGGQVGDTGTISTNAGLLEVIDTQKVAGGTIAHICIVREGSIAVGDRSRLQITDERRERLRANHSATHLLHQALREIVGDHVKQAGSKVSDRSLRFDFSHYEPLSQQQLEQIERRVNQLIIENNAVQTEIMPIDQAKSLGAMALFGEKYGQTVRVVRMGEGSLELCGGTHARRTGDLGLFIIQSESAIAAGVRRIEALSGSSAHLHALQQKYMLMGIGQLLNAPQSEIASRIQKLQESVKDFELKTNELFQKQLRTQSSDMLDNAYISSSGIKVVTQIVGNANPKQLREIADDLRARAEKTCIALASNAQDKAILLVAITDDLQSQLDANSLMQEAARILDARGGGKKDLAQAGGGNPTKLPEALRAIQNLVS